MINRGTIGMELPGILSEPEVETATELVRDYFTRITRNGQPRTGSRFEAWAGGGDASEVVNRITADDLVAVSFLGVRVSGQAAVGLLDTFADDVEKHLTEIPANRDLSDLTASELDKFLGPESSAAALWDLCRGKRSGKWGVGPTTASKILARKRPRLIPVYDSVVSQVVGIDSSLYQWPIWHEFLSNGTGLPKRLERIRKDSDCGASVSQLRIMDVALWMCGKRQGVPAIDEEDDLDTED